VPITIVQALSKEDRLGVARLRYAVYVEEMQRLQRHADHDHRTIHEPEDEGAIVLAAKDDDGSIVGTARVHLKACIPPPYVQLYSIMDFGEFHPSEVSTTTKLMVAPPFRRSPLALRLAQACYDVGIASGISFNFIDCSPRMRRFFDQLGFRQVSADFEHPEYGLVTPLVLALRDDEYLERIRSPLQFVKGQSGHRSVRFFNALRDHTHSGGCHDRGYERRTPAGT
jgi:GNAT superfamily N-acetyltransferase